MDIKPGSTVNIKITKTPANEGARKTLVRLLSKDAGVLKENARHRQVRKTNAVITQRGGRVRLWAGRVIKQHPVKGALGESGQITATLDVIRDLKSVERFIEVK